MFYPGAGFDYSPIDLFINKLPLYRIYYVDYGVDRRDTENFISSLKGFVHNSICELTPFHFNVNSWSELWFGKPDSKRYFDSVGAFGLGCDLVSNSGRIIKFNYIKAEALGTYEAIIKAKIIPNIVVVQNHGFSLNWMSNMGHELERCAIENCSLPEYLLVADNTDPWGNYKQTGEYLLHKGQANNKRAKFNLI